jgi:acyl transferase domain-containing protein
MAAVGADVEKVRQGVAGIAGVWVANINAPAQTVISGSQAAVAEALQRLHGQGLQARLLPVGCAFHSPLVEPAGRRLEAFLGSLTISSPKIKVFSNTMRPHIRGRRLSSGSWWNAASRCNSSRNEAIAPTAPGFREVGREGLSRLESF